MSMLAISVLLLSSFRLAESGVWGDWTLWTCSVPCGSGTQYRSRVCDTSSLSACVGNSEESSNCDTGVDCCAPKVFDIAYLIDVTYYSYQVTNIMTFFKSITNTLNVASYQTRISIAKMSSEVSLVIDFTTATSNIAVEAALDDIDRSYGTISTQDAFIFARGTMFTEENGARSDVSDILIMLKDGTYSDSNSDVEEAAQKLRDSGVYVMIAEEDTTRLASVADMHSSFRSATTIWLNETLNLFTSGFPCNYFCAASFFAYDDPANLGSNADASSGYLYLMTDSPFQVTCCGATSAWAFFTKDYGIVEMMIFRKSSTTNYRLIGSTRIIVPEEYVDTLVTFSLIATERIAIIAGDLIGWYSSGSNIISYEDCDTDTRSDCPQQSKKIHMADALFTADDDIDFSAATTVPNRGYSVKLSTANITLDLQTKLPSGGGLTYIITITGTDSCQHSASATVTVASYNAPPIINNLPSIHEISESTTSSIFLYTINVTDATNDPLCCTLSHTLPNSYNFQFKEENGVYSIWTADEPAFAYNDIDSYRVFICCQDAYGSTTSYLILRLTEDKTVVAYIAPEWFYRAIIISMLPISLMTILAITTLVITMFFLDGDSIVPQRTETAVSLIREPTMVSDNDDDATILSETDNTIIKPVGKSIEFKDLYKNEVVQIPVWTGKFRKAPQETDNNAWREISYRSSEIDIEEQSNLPSGQRTKGDAFGVKLNLFHFGKKPVNTLSSEEKAARILQKKNTLKEKWIQIALKAQSGLKNKTKQKKRENPDVVKPNAVKSPKLRTMVSSEQSQEETGKSTDSCTVSSENNSAMITVEEDENSAIGHDFNVDLETAARSTSEIQPADSGNENTPENEEDEISVFGEIVNTGTAGIGTNINI